VDKTTRTKRKRNRGFKLEVQHPLRVKGERQYLLLPLTGKKGVATWDIAISPRKNDTS
jgi:hypothetical protein